MKLIQIAAILVLSSILTGSYAQQPIPFSDKRWTIQAQGQVMEGYQGKNSLYLQNGMAFLKDAAFLNGIIEFDIYLSNQTSFSGLVFRMVDPINYEEFYLRAQQSGYPDAFQYTPVFNGDPAWQLYHDQHDGVNDGFVSWKPRGSLMGYNGVLRYAFDHWMHVKLLVKDNRAELYLDKMDEPVAYIRELLRDKKAGGVGIKTNVGPAHFANFSYTNTDNVILRSTDDGFKVATPAGTVLKWEVSTPFNEKTTGNMNQLDEKWVKQFQWTELVTEPGGLANLSRLSRVSDSVNCVLVRMKFDSDKDQVKKLDIGFSDRVRVYCNGTIIYSGNTSFRTRDFRYLGTIGYNDAVYLPLKKGENTIIFSVAETFGGWGIMAKF